MIDIDMDINNSDGIIYLCNSQTMKKMDADAVSRKNITYDALMRDAAEALYNHITNGKKKQIKKAAVLCGTGNNGGDGRILSQMLAETGTDTVVIDMADMTNLSCVQNISSTINTIVAESLTDEKLQKIFSQCDIIADAVFGTGFKGELNAETVRVFKIANSSKAKRIAIDIPSGVCGDDGRSDINAFRADETLTFEFIKKGLVSYPGAEFAGKIFILSIGFPEQTRNIVKESADKSILLSCSYVKNILLKLKRSANTNKGSFGKLLAICGSENMTGAAYLSAMGALRTGVGLLYLAAPRCIIHVLQTKLNEPVFMPLDIPDKIIETCEILKDSINIYDAVLFGCGFGRGAEAYALTERVLTKCSSEKTIIFDADGINAICENIDILKEIKAKKILTPHPGEMARLCGVTADCIQRDRINVAVDFAKKYDCMIVLKGALTVVADSQGDIYINPTGNAGMAKGGSGDVLAGVIASYVAQGLSPADAVCAGIYLHGLAGDIARERTSELGMLPSDLTDILAEIQDTEKLEKYK